MHLQRDREFLVNREPEHPIYSLRDSMVFPRWRPVIQLILSNFIRVMIFCPPCVPQIDPFFMPIWPEGAVTIYLWGLYGSPGACRILHTDVYLTRWNCLGGMIVATRGYSRNLFVVVWNQYHASPFRMCPDHILAVHPDMSFISLLVFPRKYLSGSIHTPSILEACEVGMNQIVCVPLEDFRNRLFSLSVRRHLPKQSQMNSRRYPLVFLTLNWSPMYSATPEEKSVPSVLV